MQKKSKLVIFDFDGVLADSFDAFYHLLRDAMKSVGISLKPQQYKNFFLGNIHQAFIDFIGNNKKYKKVMKFRDLNYTKYYNDERHKVRLFPGAVSFLKKISRNYILTIASSGRENNIKSLLKQNSIKELFDLILANSATSKAGMIKEILNKFKIAPKEMVMITDTIGDLEVAKKMGLTTIAVIWGFHSAKVLKSGKPDYLASSFKMLYKNIKAF